MSKKIRTIFIGTPDFGVPALEALINSSDFEIIAAITQPDKKIGREQMLTKPPIKVCSEKYNIPVFQPEKINNFVEELKNLKPDLIIVAAYAQIISKEILDLPKYGCLNIHASLLPKYRGAACIQAAILNGDTKTGVTIMKMDVGLDTGDIIKQFPIEIKNTDTAESMFDKLAQLGAEIIVPTILDFIEGKITPQKQNNDQASYVKILKKEDGKIDWHKSATEIDRQVRAMYSWPGTFSQLRITNDKPCLPAGRLQIVKIISVSSEIIESSDKKVGEIFLHKGKIAVQCGQNALKIETLQMAGKKALSSEEFLRGNNIVGKFFE